MCNVYCCKSTYLFLFFLTLCNMALSNEFFYVFGQFLFIDFLFSLIETCKIH